VGKKTVRRGERIEQREPELHIIAIFHAQQGRMFAEQGGNTQQELNVEIAIAGVFFNTVYIYFRLSSVFSMLACLNVLFQ
jgi:hypothetical protein